MGAPPGAPEDPDHVPGQRGLALRRRAEARPRRRGRSSWAPARSTASGSGSVAAAGRRAGERAGRPLERRGPRASRSRPPPPPSCSSPSSTWSSAPACRDAPCTAPGPTSFCSSAPPVEAEPAGARIDRDRVNEMIPERRGRGHRRPRASGSRSSWAARGLVVAVRDVGCPVWKRYGPRLSRLEAAYAARGLAFAFLNPDASRHAAADARRDPDVRLPGPLPPRPPGPPGAGPRRAEHDGGLRARRRSARSSIAAPSTTSTASTTRRRKRGHRCWRRRSTSARGRTQDPNTDDPRPRMRAGTRAGPVEQRASESPSTSR